MGESPVRVVEGEVVERSAPASWPRRIAARAAAAVILAFLSLVLCVLGILLTLTVVGALLGLPLLFFGLVLGAAALWIFFGGGAVAVWKRNSEDVL